LAGLTNPVVLYCARQRFSIDAMEGTGDLMSAMDVMGHSRSDVTRLCQHPNLTQIGTAIIKRNQIVP
jgi:muconolactone delta-isomerase